MLSAMSSKDVRDDAINIMLNSISIINRQANTLLKKI